MKKNQLNAPQVFQASLLREWFGDNPAFLPKTEISTLSRHAAKIVADMQREKFPSREITADSTLAQAMAYLEQGTIVDVKDLYREAVSAVRRRGMFLSLARLLGKAWYQKHEEILHRFYARLKVASNSPEHQSLVDRWVQSLTPDERHRFAEIVKKEKRNHREAKKKGDNLIASKILELWLDPSFPLWMMDDETGARLIEWLIRRDTEDKRFAVSTANYIKLRTRLKLPKLGKSLVKLAYYTGEALPRASVVTDN